MKEILIISLFFFSISLFSLYFGILARESVKKGEIEPLFSSPNDYRNIFLILAMVITGTLVMLSLIKIKIEVIKIIELLASFSLLLTTFSFFLPTFISIFLSIILVVISELRREYWIKNMILLLSLPSASALFGISLSFQVVILLFLVLSVYDIISVLFTKHMIYLAKNLAVKPTIFISVFPTRKVRNIVFDEKNRKKEKIRIFALGAGDYFIPSCFSVSLLSIGLMHAFLVSLFNTIGIAILFFIISRRKVSKPLPALPFLFLFSIIGYFFSFYL
ncbi:MAG: presenilin family intramembrane aspartyl protease [Candidatus Aenigmatarchaeota archaeon]